jgi:Reverse transcriptase (RNA-dependent DNA polymerase)
MDEEMNSLQDNDTFKLTTLPKDKKVVGGKWVYAVKLGPNGEEQFKARYVAKGYLQTQDIDYHEIFSPTARMTSVRMLMQLAVQQDLILHQMDVKTAYLNAPVDCEI